MVDGSPRTRSASLHGLARVLSDCVAGGASVSYGRRSRTSARRVEGFAAEAEPAGG